MTTSHITAKTIKMTNGPLVRLFWEFSFKPASLSHACGFHQGFLFPSQLCRGRISLFEKLVGHRGLLSIVPGDPILLIRLLPNYESEPRASRQCQQWRILPPGKDYPVIGSPVLHKACGFHVGNGQSRIQFFTENSGKRHEPVLAWGRSLPFETSTTA